ncbi:MAG: hypothetical protein D6714_05230 [Bacteroidetes bacterium]|nr:MAG: hypothetical protein D6714_05230 [Bacteroidota bacterium]
MIFYKGVIPPGILFARNPHRQKAGNRVPVTVAQNKPGKLFSQKKNKTLPARKNGNKKPGGMSGQAC